MVAAGTRWQIWRGGDLQASGLEAVASVSGCLCYPPAHVSSRGLLVKMMRGESIVVPGLALGLAAVFGACGSPDPEAKRLEMYRKDFTFCSKWATKREEARELLAWTWRQGSLEERVKHGFGRTQQDLNNLLGKVAEMGERMAADREACMLGQRWEKEWLADLAAKEEARREDCERRHFSRLWVCR